MTSAAVMTVAPGQPSARIRAAASRPHAAEKSPINLGTSVGVGVREVETDLGLLVQGATVRDHPVLACRRLFPAVHHEADAIAISTPGEWVPGRSADQARLVLVGYSPRKGHRIRRFH